MADCQHQFLLQELLIEKHAGVVAELLGKKCAGDYYAPDTNCKVPASERERYIHPIYWERDGMSTLESAEARASSAFDAASEYPAYHVKGAKKPDPTAFGGEAAAARQALSVKHLGYSLKVKQLGALWRYARVQRYGRGAALNVSHMYM